MNKRIVVQGEDFPPMEYKPPSTPVAESEPDPVGEDRLTVSLTEFSGAHALLKAVYLDDDQPLTRRIRCAIAAIPYEVGKLTASTPSGNGRGFAAQLEAARRRSREALLIEHAPQVQPQAGAGDGECAARVAGAGVAGLRRI